MQHFGAVMKEHESRWFENFINTLIFLNTEIKKQQFSAAQIQQQCEEL